MSEREHTVLTGNIAESESPNLSLSQLIELARQAYDQRRTKNCLDLVKAILRIDSENAEAQLMRSSIRMEMHLDLENARALLRDAHLKDSPQRYSEAGNTVLRKILSMDPDSEEAKTLLSEVQPSVPVAPPPRVVRQLPINQLPGRSFRLQVTTERRPWIPRALVIISIALVAAGLLILRSRPNTAEATRTFAGSQPTPTLNENKVVRVADDQSDASTRLGSLLVSIAAAVAAETAAPAKVPAAPSPPPSPDLRPLATPVVLAASGNLAVSSPTSVDIYRGDQYIGSAPVTLDMSPGTYTFEYRHEELRKTVTHVIKSNETTRAMINFDVSVQINAKPWADVFLDGTERKPLGQTPMSDVRVPIGGVLVFENPKFQAKKYRVTGREKAIQIVFP